MEGVSDSTAISTALEEIFNSNQVTVKISDGDITGDKNTTPQNIKTKIVEQIKQQFGRTVKPSDFVEVIQLVDTDGTFINPQNIIQDDNEKVFYGEDTIKCKNVDCMKQHNEKKALVLDSLISLSCVWTSIPYSIYFFSSNLDHVLHNDSNLDDSEKYKKAFEFAKKYKNDSDGFINFFSSKDYAIDKTYQGSWEFIKEGSNSLKRFTNFNLIFTERAKNNNLREDETS